MIDSDPTGSGPAAEACLACSSHLQVPEQAGIPVARLQKVRDNLARPTVGQGTRMLNIHVRMLHHPSLHQPSRSQGLSVNKTRIGWWWR